MKAESLYLNEYEVYTDEANAFEEKAREAIQPFFESAKECGFSLRDASHILMCLVRELEAETIIKRNTEEYRRINPRLKFKTKGE